MELTSPFIFLSMFSLIAKKYQIENLPSIIQSNFYDS